jgi:hypothetical protein
MRIPDREDTEGLPKGRLKSAVAGAPCLFTWFSRHVNLASRVPIRLFTRSFWLQRLSRSPPREACASGMDRVRRLTLRQFTF